MKKKYDVVIVGFGPVGAVTAKLLAKGGMNVLIVDKAIDIFDKPRAIGIDHEAMRILQFCGIAHDIFPHVRVFKGSEWHAADGTVLRSFEPSPPPYPLGWPPNMTFLQPQLERLLRDSVKQCANVDIALQTQAIDLSQNHHGVTVVLHDLGEDVEHTIEARYLIGADGASSVVREKLNIGLEDLQFDEWWIVVDMLRTGQTDYGDRNVQYCNPARPGTYVVGPGNLRRWEFRILPHESPDDFRNEQRVLQMMAEQVDLSGLELWRSAVYRFHALVAKHWHVGRIFLAGDAAHQTPPHLGQGLVSGLRDAANLTWKIMQVEAGADIRLFDSYMQERRPHFHSLVSKAKEFGCVIGILDPEEAKQRDKQLLQALHQRTTPETRQNHIPALLDGFFATHKQGALMQAAGTLFMQPTIQTPSGAQLLDDVASQCWQLLSLGDEAQQWLTPECSAIWNALGAQRMALMPTTSATCSALEGVIYHTETDGRFHAWMATHPAKAVIIRPDRYVYGIANNAAELNALIHEMHNKMLNVSCRPANGKPETTNKSAAQLHSIS